MIDADDFANHPTSVWEEGHMVRGRAYRVKTSFVDADGIEHVAGEEWTFIGGKFAKFENEYALCIRFRSGALRLLLLQSNKGQQDDVLRHPKRDFVMI